MIFNEEQYKYLEQFETSLYHAEYENYFRIVNRNMLLEFSKIYKSVFKSDSKILNGCNKCILSDIKRLAKAYFSDKKEYDKQNKAVEEEKPKKMSEYSYDSKKAATTKKTAKNNKK